MNGNAIISAGIDVGTSTTQVVFAQLMLENTSEYFAVPHISFGSKKKLYQSQIYCTPLINSSLLDGEKLHGIVKREYCFAGYTPADVETGAVIITGEAARKENALIVLQSLSGLAGDFVVATAGPDLESVLAGKGSGAEKASRNRGITVVNLDIGGGTTNLALFSDGKTSSKGCLDIGGRLVRIERNTVSFVSQSAAKIAAAEGLRITAGMTADIAALKKLCAAMAGLLEQALGLAPETALLHEIRSTGSSSLEITERIDAICFSGGVADLIGTPQPDCFKYGDIGQILGEAIADSRLCTEFERLSPAETIRATVVGAGCYSTSISGSTITQQAGILPLKNLPVLKLNDDEQRLCFEGDSLFLRDKLRWFISQSDCSQMVLSFDGEQSPGYHRMSTLAGCLYAALDAALPPGAPLILALESDTAKALGQLLKTLANGKRAVICIDEIRAESGDYMDLGCPLMEGMVIPVVVKTLAFG